MDPPKAENISRRPQAVCEFEHQNAPNAQFSEIPPQAGLFIA